MRNGETLERVSRERERQRDVKLVSRESEKDREVCPLKVGVNAKDTRQCNLLDG